MKEFKFIGDVLETYEWTIEVEDNQTEQDAWEKLWEKGHNPNDLGDGVKVRSLGWSEIIEDSFDYDGEEEDDYFDDDEDDEDDEDE